MLGDDQMIIHGVQIQRRSQLSFYKGRHSGDISKHNPIIIAFKGALTPHFEKKGEVTAFHLIIGIEVPGRDP
ncbi:hypothetical protein F7725_009561, partial [Dissostichus mawsoni]